MDEDHIWAFHRTLFNQEVVKNTWSDPKYASGKLSFAPFWGEKLSMPAWYKREKMDTFQRHWNHRRGLEMLKQSHVIRFGTTPSEQARQIIQDEIAGYIQASYDHEKLVKMQDITVTDHKPVAPKRVTDNEEEDQDFFEYQQALDAYNNDGHANRRFGQRRARYEKGSFLQKLFDPLAGAPHDANGTTLFSVTDDNLRHFNLSDEAALRAEYEKLKSHDEVWETDEEDEVAFKLELLRQLQNNETEFRQDDFEDVLTRELSVFAKGEKYNYTKDLTDAYKNSLATTTEEKIFR
jgi:hypothetical protein